MFFDYERQNKSRGIPGKYWFLLAAGVVIICQLIALILLADSQVAKAKVRDESLSAQRLAIAQCIEANIGPKRHHCIRGVSVASASSAQQRQPGKVIPAGRVPVAITALAMEADTPVTPVLQVESVMPAALSVR